MLLRSIAAAVVVSFALSPAYAEQPAKAKGKATAKRVVQAPKERHQCKVGPYEKQTRLVMETVKNKPVYVAYWSSDGPFHCSFETWPGDGRARWVDSKAGTVINLISGTMLIERNGDKYYIHARDVDRMPYCGTFGTITGVLTVPVKKGQCDWTETSTEEAGRLKQNDNTPAEAVPAEAPPAEPAPAASPLEAAPVNPIPAVGGEPGRVSRADPG
jgi:hypothetical protein